MKQIGFVIIITMLTQAGWAQQIGEYQRFHLEGRKQVVAGNFQAAVDSFTVAIHIMPYYSAIYLDRAEARLQTEDYNGAARDFSQVINKAPFKTFAFFGRGVAYFNLGEFRLAESDFNLVLGRWPGNFEAMDYLQRIQGGSNVTSSVKPTAQNTRIDGPTRSDREALYRKRERDWLIWGYAVPWAIWTTAYLIWH